MKPMAYGSVDVDGLEPFIKDPKFVFEQKLDGTRALIRITDQGMETFSRSGQPLKHTAAVQHLANIFDSLSVRPIWPQSEVIFDGEIMIDTGVYHIFDLPKLEPYEPGQPTVCPQEPFELRSAALACLWGKAHVLTGGPYATIVDQYRTEAEKRKLVETVEANQGEGVMVKHAEAPYEPGTRVSHSFKAKFIRTVDVIVTKVDRPDAKHGSITFAIHSLDVGRPVQLGSCSAIGKPEVEPGDVIEVRYLAWQPGGGLREPRMVRVRHDKLPEDCTFDQLVPYSKEVL